MNGHAIVSYQCYHTPCPYTMIPCPLDIELIFINQSYNQLDINHTTTSPSIQVGRKYSVALLLLKQALLLALKKYDYRVVNIWGGSNVTTLALVSSLVQKSLMSYFHSAFICKPIGGLLILLEDIVANVCALQLLRLRIERFQSLFAAMRMCLGRYYHMSVEWRAEI